MNLVTLIQTRGNRSYHTSIVVGLGGVTQPIEVWETHTHNSDCGNVAQVWQTTNSE